MSKYKLHKLKEDFIVTSDEEIKTGDIKWHHVTGLRKALVDGNYTNQFKVIAQQDQIDFSLLSEEEQKKIGWYDSLKLGNLKYIKECNGDLELNDYLCGFTDGFQESQKLLSDKKFTENDIMYAMKHAIKYYSHMWDDSDGKKIINSLFKQLWDVEYIEENGKVKITKIGRDEKRRSNL